MAHHKRRRPKNRRGGCLLCKPHKANGAKRACRLEVYHGFGKLRDGYHAERDMRAEKRLKGDG